ncbi:MAG TPA: hypothetical protein VK308_16980 [Pyrinomonadaceae bacterium]|nr:hypothetical protein [Pyrinomonadaceae bacterium]
MNIFENLIEDLKEENLLEETVIRTGGSPDTVKTEAAPIDEPAANPAAEAQPAAPLDETEFRRKRATDEVAFLQIVEHVFAGVEREQLKIVPKTYDDLKIKKTLHNFLQISPDADLSERSKAEFQLMQEIESWHWSLTQRDERLTAAHLRRYCETSRPPLSSAALMALAKFYRNSPHSEPVRNKFDLVVTRIFSNENDAGQRDMVFNRGELASHLAELYAEWSSVPLYSTEADDAEILEIVRKFESYAEYADAAIDFDDLIKSDFFTRLHTFKRDTNENFYAPPVTAAAVETNIRIGNRYIELLESEKQQGNVISLETRYGISHDNAISEATAKTYSLIEQLKQRKPAPPVKEKTERKPEAGKEKFKPAAEEQSKSSSSAKPNKWLITAAILAILVTAGIYFGTKSGAVETKNAAGKPVAASENSMSKDYLQEARVENGKLIAIVSPTWSQMTEEKRKGMLKQMLAFGSEKGYRKVQLENKEGKTIGVAADGSILVLE